MCATIALVYSKASTVWECCDGQLTLALTVLCPVVASYLLFTLTDGWVAYGTACLVAVIGAFWFVRGIMLALNVAVYFSYERETRSHDRKL